MAVLDNLETYYDVLKDGKDPLQIKFGFIHHEPRGIKAIDQKGVIKKFKLKETRLYIFADNLEQILYVLSIGDKHSQKRDIKEAVKTVDKIKGGKKNG